MTMVYRFKDAAHLDKRLDAQAVGERLEALRASGSGFTAEGVVEDARDPSAPYHAHFTWDDAEAAEKYRVTEAGYLIRSLVTIQHVEGKEDYEVRAFVTVTIDEDDRRYLPIAVAMEDPDHRAEVVARALGEMLALRRKYRDLEELARIFRAIDAVAAAKKKAAS